MAGRFRPVSRPISACPFCGANGLNLVMVGVSTADVENAHQVECRACYASGPICGKARAAKQAWTRRVVPSWLLEAPEVARGR